MFRKYFGIWSRDFRHGHFIIRTLSTPHIRSFFSIFFHFGNCLYVMVWRLLNRIIGEYSGHFRRLCVLSLFVNAFVHQNVKDYIHNKYFKKTITDLFGSHLTITYSFDNLAEKSTFYKSVKYKSCPKYNVLNILKIWKIDLSWCWEFKRKQTKKREKVSQSRTMEKSSTVIKENNWGFPKYFW